MKTWEEVDRLEIQLNILDLMESCRQLGFFGVAVFTRRHLLFQVAFAVAVEVGFIAVFAVFQVNGSVPLIMQRPCRAHKCLTCDTTYQKEERN